MAVTKMSLVNIVGPLDKFDDIVRSCIVESSFSVENVIELAGATGSLVPFSSQNPHRDLLSKAQRCMETLGIEPDYRHFSAEFDAAEAEAYTARVEAQYRTLLRDEEEQRRVIDESEQVIKQLENIRQVRCDLDLLFRLRYVRIRFGRMPRDIYHSFLKHIENDPDMFFFPAGNTREHIYGLYMCPQSCAGKTDARLSSLRFERVTISGLAHGTPEQAIASLQEAVAGAQLRLSEIEGARREMVERELDGVLSVYSAARFLHDTYELRRYAAHTQDTFYLCGWVPVEELKAFSEAFDRVSDAVFVVEEPDELPGLTPPTRLRNRGFVRVFEQFVRMYGMPAYNEIDPTPLLAISYTLFFGAMFGDVGQGAVLIAAGLLAHRFFRMALGKIIAVIGCSSVLFGFLYGSVFGNEHILPGFKAFESTNNTNLILICAVGVGLVFISVAMALNILNGIRQKDAGKAWFSHNGLAGFVFYWALIAGVLVTMLTDVKLLSPLYISLLIVLPLLLIFLQHPLAKLATGRKDWRPKRPGEYFVESFFELFEVLLSFLANTISFVRIGAFALNHIGMMLVVFALAESVGRSGSWFVFIFGNVFVICLEGLIVGIQVLRLEFYELFGRFYTGNGREFVPFTVQYKKK